MLKTLTLTIVVWLCYFQKVAPVPMTVLHPPPTPPLTPPPPECQRDGKSYPEGFHLKVSPCEFCDCYAGQFQCVIADCFIVQCVDYIQDPNRCCPVCPNGKNCYAGNKIIPAGPPVKMDNYTTCQCPEGIGFGMTAHHAKCTYHASTVMP